MNGAECGKCGHIQCTCKEIEKSKDERIKKLEADVKARDELLNKLAGYTASRLKAEEMLPLIKQALKGE